jgi:hypothetical protein
MMTVESLEIQCMKCMAYKKEKRDGVETMVIEYDDYFKTRWN